MSMSRREVVFLDSSVILRYFLGDPRAREVVEGDWVFAVNAIVYSEVSFNLLKFLYARRYGEYKFYSMKQSLSRLENEVLEGYTMLNGFLEELDGEERLVFLPATMEVVREAGRIAARYGLLPNDALIASTCKHYGVNIIATFDEDFKRIPWLKVIP